MAIQQSQKFTPEEINSVKTLQANVQNVTLKFGQLCVQKLNLEEQEGLLKNELESLKQEESKLAQQFSEKYGKGTIDIDTGEFTPSN